MSEQVTLRFYEELNDFLPAEHRKLDFEHAIARGQTAKDLIEALGIPHTEVDLILVNGESVEFGYQLQSGDRLSVYPVFERLDVPKVSQLHPHPLRKIKFVLDSHLAKLARYLRMLGFDSLHQNSYSDAEIAELSVRDNRIVLTRDRGLLKRRIITHGRCVRNIEPRKQLLEIMHWLDLSGGMQPFTRCIRCNGLLKSVSKQEIEAQLQPDTRRYYQQFWQCGGCGHVYWKGSHFHKMQQWVSELLSF